MTDHPADTETETVANVPSSPTTATGILSRVLGRLRGDPLLAVPLVVAGLVVTLLEVVRRRDPIPAHSPTQNGFEISVELFPVPSGTQATTRTIGGLIDLKPRLLLYATGLELLGILAVSLAGYLTIARALDADLSITSAGTYLLYAFLTVGWTWPIGSLEMNFPPGSFPLWIPLLALWFYLMIRLFAVPAAITDGDGIVRAIRRSNAAIRGLGWTVLGIIVALGLAVWAAGFVPRLPTLASFAVASLHAVAVVVVYETRTASG